MAWEAPWDLGSVTRALNLLSFSVTGGYPVEKGGNSIPIPPPGGARAASAGRHMGILCAFSQETGHAAQQGLPVRGVVPFGVPLHPRPPGQDHRGAFR